LLRRKILIRRDGHGALEPREPYTTLGNRGRIIRAPLENHVTHWFPKRSWAVMGASSATGAAVDLRYTIGASWRRQSASAIPIYVLTISIVATGCRARAPKPSAQTNWWVRGRLPRPSLFTPNPSLSTSTEVTPCSYSQLHLYSSTREPHPRARPALRHPFAIIPQLTNPLSLSKVHGCCLLRAQALLHRSWSP
jgi:hypothetical protein